jgi:hypothetical protein
MKLKSWPVTEDEYWDAIRQLMQFISLFKAPLEPEVQQEVEESTELLDKLYLEACQKFSLVGDEDFWKWCFRIACVRLAQCGC